MRYFLVIIFFFFIGCKSIKKDKSSSSIEQSTNIEKTEDTQSDKSKTSTDSTTVDIYQEVTEEKETRSEVVYHPETKEAIILPVTRSVTTTRVKVNDTVVSTITESESSESAIFLNEESDVKGDSTSVNKESEGQDASDIVGSVSTGLFEGVLKALFGNAIKWLTTITIIGLLIIIFIITKKKKSKNNL